MLTSSHVAGMAAKVLFTCPVSATISLKNLGKEEKLYYASVGVFCEDYVITKQFKKLLTTLTSGERVVVLRGPKGVGKSVTLGALTAISQLPTFLCAVKSSEGGIWQLYLQKLVDQAGLAPKKAHLDPGEFLFLCTLSLRVESDCCLGTRAVR